MFLQRTKNGEDRTVPMNDELYAMSQKQWAERREDWEECPYELRILSAGNSTFKYDFGSEDREGRRDSTVSVFTRDADGALRHFYTAHPWMAPDIRERGIDLLAPIWHFMDLTPQGRGNWYASLDYGANVHAAST